MCKSPLKGFRYGKTESGKDNYIIRSSDVDHLEVLDGGRIINVYSPMRSASHRVIRDFIEIPCGKCIECQLAYSRRWADRCMLEAQYHSENCFITLTYDENNVPKVSGIDPITGEPKVFNSLVKKDFQDFMKRLRNKLNEIPKDERKDNRVYYRKGDDNFKEIRFLACGEYGSHTSRPHYHVIIFGWKPSDDDVVELGKNDMGDSYFGSQVIADTWHYGFHVVGACDWNSCAYVSRYVTKKMFKIEKDFYEITGIQPEFLLMSRRPGIGSQWYEDHKICYSTFLNTYLKSEKGSHKIGTVKYFDNKLMNDFPKAYEDIKEKRVKYAQMSNAIKRYQTSLPYLDMLHVEENNLESRTKILKGGQL